MKQIIIAIFIIASFGADAQKNQYILTGYQFDKQDQSSHVTKNCSHINIMDEKNMGAIFISNKGLSSLLQGAFIEDNIPNTVILKSATKNECLMIQKKLHYFLEHLDDSAKSDYVYGDISVIFVYKEDRVLIDCTILTAEGHTLRYSGYRLI